MADQTNGVRRLRSCWNPGEAKVLIRSVIAAKGKK
jgi:hypothetical protein